MRPSRVTTLVLAAAVAGGAGAAPSAGAAPRSVERQADDLLNRASLHVQRTRPACVPEAPSGRADAAVTDAEPSAALRSVLAPFRRAPAAAELAAAEDPRITITLPGTAERSRRGTRLLHASDGREIRLTFAPKLVEPGLEPKVLRDCVARTSRRATRLARSASPAVRRRVRRLLDAQRADAARAVPPRTGEALSLSVPLGAEGSGATGGLFDAQRFAEQGLFLMRGRPAGKGASSELIGVVPDGVATVELVYPSRASRGPGRPAVEYEAEALVTVTVVDNAVSATVPRSVDDTFRARLIWRRADGSVIRVVTRR